MPCGGLYRLSHQARGHFDALLETVAERRRRGRRIRRCIRPSAAKGQRPNRSRESVDAAVRPSFSASSINFLAKLPGNWRRCSLRLEDEQWDELAELAHWLKGIGRNRRLRLPDGAGRRVGDSRPRQANAASARERSNGLVDACLSACPGRNRQRSRSRTRPIHDVFWKKRRMTSNCPLSAARPQTTAARSASARAAAKPGGGPDPDRRRRVGECRRRAGPSGNRRLSSTSIPRPMPAARSPLVAIPAAPTSCLLDIHMPEMSGIEILKAIRAEPAIAMTPVVILTASSADETKLDALQCGANDLLSKPVHRGELLARIRNVLERQGLSRRPPAGTANRWKTPCGERTAELVASRLDVIQCLARAAEFRDDDTGRAHFPRGPLRPHHRPADGASAAVLEILEPAAQLHDVGKIGIPDAILLKPGKLAPEEFELMQKHCGYGEEDRGMRLPTATPSSSAATPNWGENPRHRPLADLGDGQTHRPDAPRALGRIGLSAGTVGRGHPAWKAASRRWPTFSTR